VVFYHSLLTGLNGAPLAVIEGGTLTFIRADHIGRPAFATNSTGTKVWSATYNPFGGVRTTTGSPITARFPGQWFQSESGLHQNWMRDYDPTTGRYLQADPLGLIDGASVYGYARQNPGRWTDPRGEQTYGPEIPFTGLGPLPGADHYLPKEGIDPPHSIPREYKLEICTMGVPCGTGISRFGFDQMYCLPGTRPSTTNPGSSRKGGYEAGVATNPVTGQQTVTHLFFNKGNDCSMCAIRQMSGPFYGAD
jgi:RHS repeat-associated protein